MKVLNYCKVFIISLFLFSACGETKPASAEQSKGVSTMTTEISVQIGEHRFELFLLNNETALEFKKILPLKIRMIELNGNEKYSYLTKPLPASPKNITEIKTGDLMLFSDDCLVLFYKDFKTSYRYTPIGRLRNPQKLSEILGKDSVEISFISQGSNNALSLE